MANREEDVTREQCPGDEKAIAATRDHRGVDITLIDELLRLEPVERDAPE